MIRKQNILLMTKFTIQNWNRIYSIFLEGILIKFLNIIQQVCEDGQADVCTYLSRSYVILLHHDELVGLMEERSNSANVNSLNIFIPEDGDSSICMNLCYLPWAFRQYGGFQFPSIALFV